MEKIIPLIILYSDVQTTFNRFTDSVCTADCTSAIITTNSTGTGKVEKSYRTARSFSIQPVTL